MHLPRKYKWIICSWILVHRWVRFLVMLKFSLSMHTSARISLQGCSVATAIVCLFMSASFWCADVTSILHYPSTQIDYFLATKLQINRMQVMVKKISFALIAFNSLTQKKLLLAQRKSSQIRRGSAADSHLLFFYGEFQRVSSILKDMQKEERFGFLLTPSSTFTSATRVSRCCAQSK